LIFHNQHNLTQPPYFDKPKIFLSDLLSNLLLEVGNFSHSGQSMAKFGQPRSMLADFFRSMRKEGVIEWFSISI